MTKKLSKILFASIFFFFLQVSAEEKGPAPKKAQLGLKLSSVELQWEDSPGAFMYEVEIFNSKNKKLKSFVSKSSLFKFKSTSGRIKIRGRVIDAFNNKGLWSSLIDVEVPPEDLKFPAAKYNEPPIVVQASNSTSKGRVNLTWPESIQARRYNVKVYDQDNKVVAEKEVSNLSEKFDLDVGSYRFSVTPIGVDRIFGKETISPKQIQIGSAQMPSEKFIVQKKGKLVTIQMPARKNFEIFGALEYANHLSEVWTPVLSYTPFADDIWTPSDELKAGRYRIGFWVTRKGWVPSNKFHHEFVVKPSETDIADLTR